MSKSRKTEHNILIAFLLNLGFSAFEFSGGLFTGSIAIMSDAVHDLGDAISIAVSYVLEKVSKKGPDEVYTYGYARYSVIGGVITTSVLLAGSIMIIISSIRRLINPVEINYNGMIVIGIFGVIVNFLAAYITKDGDSVNQKSVNLHMLEDVLGWVVVLVGAVIMRFTDIKIIDPLMSIGVSVFILINALKNLSEILNIFLEKTPKGIDISKIKEHLKEIDGVEDVHHIHVWSMDGQSNYATLHVVTDKDSENIKKDIREEMLEHGIGHLTIEIEKVGEECSDIECHVEEHSEQIHHHHHH